MEGTDTMHNYGLEEMLKYAMSETAYKILIWGAYEKSDYVLNFFKDNHVEIYGYIDSAYKDKCEYRGYKVYDSNIIKSQKFYVYVALENTYNDILFFLNECGYKEYLDFWYPCRMVRLCGYQPYSDYYGNEYEGYGYDVKISLKRCGKCFLEKGIEMSNTVTIEVFDDSELNVLSECSIGEGCSVRVCNNSYVKIYNKCRLSKYCILDSKHGSAIQLWGVILVKEQLSAQQETAQSDSDQIANLGNQIISSLQIMAA